MFLWNIGFAKYGTASKEANMADGQLNEKENLFVCFQKIVYFYIFHIIARTKKEIWGKFGHGNKKFTVYCATLH